MLIGVDFDNTIVCYDEVFYKAARKMGIALEGLEKTKLSIRDRLRKCGKEDSWTKLQGYVYGRCMRDANLFPGVLSFFKRCRLLGVAVVIISHKTRFPYLGPKYNLHKEAQAWLKSHGFYDTSQVGLSREVVYFEETKEKKINRISSLNCDFFIDDLSEFLMDPSFPPGVEKWHFSPQGHHFVSTDLKSYLSWKEIEEELKSLSGIYEGKRSIL